MSRITAPNNAPHEINRNHSDILINNNFYSSSESGYSTDSENGSRSQSSQSLSNRNDHYIPLLHAAVKQNNFGSTKSLLESKNNNQADLDSGLTAALENKNIDLKIVKLLFKKGANLKQEDKQNLLELVIKENSIPTFKKLLDHRYGVFLKKDLNNALHLTAKYNRSKIAKLLLNAKKVDISYKNEQNDTPLHTAVRHNNEKMFDIFLKNAPDTQFSLNKDQASPLHLAAENGNTQLALLLLQSAKRYKSSISYQITKHLRQHFQFSFFAGKTKPNLMATPTYNGDTPLHLAAKSGNAVLFSILASQSTAVLLARRNHQGHTASEIMESKKVEGNLESNATSYVSRGTHQQGFFSNTPSSSSSSLSEPIYANTSSEPIYEEIANVRPQR